MANNTVLINDCWKLTLRIYVLGYYPEGESILIVLYDESSYRPLQTILVDCYEQDNLNQMDKILKRYGLNSCKLDYVIWTHSDRDHSVGFSNIVNNYVLASKTTFLLPEGLTFSAVLNDWDKIKSWFSIIVKGKRKQLAVERVNTSNKRRFPLVYHTTYFDGVNDEVDFEIEILTPFAHQSFHHLERNQTYKANHLSISFVIRFGNLGFYFGGDVENEAIKEIDELRLRDICFVKIPHHGSNSSNELPFILSNTNGEVDYAMLAVTTGFHKGKTNLPSTDVLGMYKKRSFKVLKTEDDTHRAKYGIWECVFDRVSRNLWTFNPFGDAIEYI